MKWIERMVSRFEAQRKKTNRRNLGYLLAGMMIVCAMGWMLHYTAFSMTGAPEPDASSQTETSAVPQLEEGQDNDSQAPASQESDNPEAEQSESAAQPADPFPLPALSGDTVLDLKAIAQSQIGASDPSRYGSSQAVNVSFIRYCLQQAGIASQIIPSSDNLTDWIEQFKNQSNHWIEDTSNAQTGDLAFIDQNGDQIPDQLVIVTTAPQADTVSGIGYFDQVSQQSWSADQILGFAVISGRSIPTASDHPQTDPSKTLELISARIEQQSDGAWTEIANGVIQNQSPLRLVLDIHLTDSPNQTLSLELPEPIHATASQGTIYEANGQSIGTWTFEGSNLDLMLDSNQPLDQTARIELPLTLVDLSFTGNTELIADNEPIPVWISDAREELELQTTVHTPDASSSVLRFESTIHSTTGTITPITVHGDLGNQRLVGSITVIHPDGQSQTIRPDSTSAFDLTLDELDENEDYILRFQTRLPAMADQEDLLVKTSLTASAQNGYGQPLEAQFEWSETFNVSMISGWGQTNNQNAQWTFQINPRHQNLSGDILNMEVNGQPITAPVSISPSIDGQDQITLPFIFPDTSQSYTLTTQPPLSNKAQQAQIVLKQPDGNQASFHTDLDQIVSGNPLSMSSNGYQLVEGTDEAQLNWKIEVDPSQAPVEDNWTLEQELPEGQWYTASQITDLEKSMKDALNVHGLDPEFSTQVTEENEEPFAQDADQINASKRYTAFKMSGLPKLNGQQELSISQRSTTTLDSSSQQAENEITLNETHQARAVLALDANTIPITLADANSSTLGNTTHTYEEMISSGIGWRLDMDMPSSFTAPVLKLSLDYPEEISATALTLSIPGLDFSDDQLLFKLINKPWIQLTINGSLVTVSKTGNNVTFEFPQALVSQIAASGNPQVTVLSNGQIAGYEWPPEVDGVSTGTFTAQAHLSDTYSNDLGGTTQTQTVNRTLPKAKPIEKNASRNPGNNDINYQLKVNSDAKDLSPSTGWIEVLDSSYIAATIPADAVTSFKLVPSTLKVFTEENGTQTPLNSSQYSYSWQTVPGSNPPTQRLRIRVPDGKALVIKYTYRMIGPHGNYMTIANSAAIVGYPGSVGGFTLESQALFPSTDIADSQGFTVIKVDENSYSTKLSGAEFDLYRYNSTIKDYVRLEGDDQPNIVTNSEGSVYLNNLTPDTAYQIRETKAPDGYKLSTEPISFLIKGDGTVLNAPDNFPETQKYPPGGEVFVPNTKVDTSITVKKQWLDENGQPDASDHDPVEIELYRRTADKTRTIEWVNKLPISGPSWQIQFNDLKSQDEDGNPYLYYIVEVPAEQKWNISYINNEGIQSGEITVVNQKLRTGGLLPETGSDGGQMILLAGAGLLSAAMVFAVQKRMNRRSKEEKP